MGLATAILLDTAARGTGKHGSWARREAEVRRRLAPAELVQAHGPAEAEQAAWEAAMAGYGRLIVAGNFATAHGVVNGLMRLSDVHLRGMKVGFLPPARPDPWFLAAGLVADFGRQLDILSAANVFPLDVGRVTCVALDGAEVTRHFLAGAALGLAPAAQPGGAAWWRALSAAAAGVGDLLRSEPARVLLTCDGSDRHRGVWTLGLAMLSSHYPGLGRVAPQAQPSDGALDLCWIGSPSLGAMAAKTLGLLLKRPGAVEWALVRECRVEGLDGMLAVEADGFPIGRLPARLTVLPRALPVIVAAVADRLRERQHALLAQARGAALAGGMKRAMGE